MRLENAQGSLRVALLQEEVCLQNGHAGNKDAVRMLLYEGTENGFRLRQGIALQVRLSFQICAVIIERGALHIRLAECGNVIWKFAVQQVSMSKSDVRSRGNLAG